MDRRYGKLLRAMKGIILAIGVLVVVLIGIILFIQSDPGIWEEKPSRSNKEPDSEMPDESDDRIVNGIHMPTGLVDGEGLGLVIANCTNCHSAKLIAQNRADRQGWTSMIRWMQETQNLWDLGINEDAILNYLSENYAPEGRGRRAPLTGIEWYELKE